MSLPALKTLLLVFVGLLAASSRAAEPTREEKARAELERQLRELVPESPAEVVITFEGFDPKEGYKLVDTDFLVDGQPLAVPTVDELNGPGSHRLAVLKLEPGEHSLVSRVTYANSSWNLFSETNGFLWKITASVGFRAQRGLRVRVKVVPTSVPNAPDPRLKLKLTHDVKAELLEPIPDEPLADSRPAPVSAAPVKVVQTPPAKPPAPAPARDGKLQLKVTAKKKPVPATVFVRGLAAPRQVALERKPTDVALAAGTYSVDVVAKGFLAQTRRVVLAAGAESSLAFALVPTPKKAKVAVKGERVELPTALDFAEQKPTPGKGAAAGVDLLVDLLVREAGARLRIEGHTDGQEVPAPARKALSEARAKAVADLLVRAGVDPARLETAGLGDSRPVAPNLIPRGRQLNRRVELSLVRK